MNDARSPIQTLRLDPQVNAYCNLAPVPACIQRTDQHDFTLPVNTQGVACGEGIGSKVETSIKRFRPRGERIVSTGISRTPACATPDFLQATLASTITVFAWLPTLSVYCLPRNARSTRVNQGGAQITLEHLTVNTSVHHDHKPMERIMDIKGLLYLPTF